MAKTYIWRDPTLLTRLSLGALAGSFLVKCASAAVWAFYGQAAAYSPAQAAFSDPQRVHLMVDQAAASFELVSLVLIVWLWRVSSNAHAFRPNMRWSPAWAIGWYLPPLACLVMPFVCMVEIWRASAKTPSANVAIVTRWWSTMVVWNCLGSLYEMETNPFFAPLKAYLGLSDQSLTAPVQAIGLAYDIFAAALALLSIQLVHRLGAMQVEKHGRG